MVIKSLKLRNYRRFRQLDLELPENIIGIMGRNGAGKSTIVEAIAWALYGNRMVRSDRFDVRSIVADEREACVAEMVFVYGGEEYRIERRLKGRQAISEAAIWRAGRCEPEAVQDRGVNEFIENLLQLDYKSFLASVFAQQKELDKLSTLTAEERRQAINRLINIDRIDRARDEVRKEINNKSNRADGMRLSAKNLDELKDRKKELLQDRTQLIAAREQAEEKAAAREAEAAEAKRQLEASALLRDQYQQWEAQIGRLESRREEQDKNQRRTLAELEQVRAAEAELAQLKPQFADFEAVELRKKTLDAEWQKSVSLQSLLKEKERVRSLLDKEQASLAEALELSRGVAALENEAAALQAKEAELEAALKSLREKEKHANGRKAAAEEKGKELKQKLAGIQQLGPEGECPVCSRRLGDQFERVVHNHEAQLEQLRQAYRRYWQEEEAALQAIRKMEEELRRLRLEQQQLAGKVQRSHDARRRAEEIEGRIRGHREDLEQIEKQIADLGAVEYDKEEHAQVKARFEVLQKLVQQALRLEERAARRRDVEWNLQAAQKALAELSGEAAEARKAQQALGFDEADYQRKKQAVDEATRRLDAARETVNAVQLQMAALERDLENIAKEIDEQEQLQQELKALEEEVGLLRRLDELFGKFRLDLAGRLRPLIARRTSELLAMTTHGRYSQIELDVDYALLLYDGNQPFPLKRFSGGEQDLVNLCLRIAVSQVVAERFGAPINCIVLDEIFGSQDNERRDLILDALNRLSSQFCQIFIITHIESVRDSLPVLVDVEMIDESTSRARLI